MVWDKYYAIFLRNFKLKELLTPHYLIDEDTEAVGTGQRLGQWHVYTYVYLLIHRHISHLGIFPTSQLYGLRSVLVILV